MVKNEKSHSFSLRLQFYGCFCKANDFVYKNIDKRKKGGLAGEIDYVN